MRLTDSDASREPIEQLAEAFLERYRRGERPRMSEYIRAHPDLADDIRDLFPALVEMEGLKSDVDGSTGREALPIRPAPDRLGDYRIVREIGRGGMGVVYEAVQETLGRSVALKVMPREYVANPTYLDRFRREARSAARLHHTNIVPVFGVGEHEGFHFFAMQLIRGQTLEAVLQEVHRLRQPVPASRDLEPTEAARECAALAHSLVRGHSVAPTGPATEAATPLGPASPEPDQATQIDGGTDGDGASAEGRDGLHATRSTDSLATQIDAHYYRSVSRIGLQVAEALAYAHEQGIVHRDIKPSNILIDLAGTAWVADFGLAKLVGAEDLTATRDILGTLRFMAPERFDGVSDNRSDVYGLGVTLYELLTLRPAFEAADQPRLVRQIMGGTPVSPQKIDRNLPRDLETICLKAMARDPAERYACAGALAEDLRRFLADRTILARRTTTHERLWRWCRRNPAIAALLSAVAALLLFIAGYSSVAAARYRRAVAESRERLFASYIDQARASRSSRRPGQRFAALDAIRKAAAIHRTPELRDEAIACLALPDLKLVRRWPGAFRWSWIDPSFTFIAQMNHENEIFVRRVADNSEIQRIELPPNANSHFVNGCFNADGLHFAVSYPTRDGGGQSLRVYRIGAAEPVLIDRKVGKYLAADFTPDGRRIAIAEGDRSVRLYNLGTGRVERCWGNDFSPCYLRFSPDGRQMGVLHDQTGLLQVRNISTCELVAEIRRPLAHSFSWNADGHALAVNADDRRIYLYSVPTGQIISVLEHRDYGLTSAFSPTGFLVATNGWEARMRIWHPFTGELALSVPAKELLGFRRDGHQLAATTLNHEYALYDVADGRVCRTLARQPGRARQAIGELALHPQGRLLAVPIDDGVGFWDIEHDTEIGFLPIGRSTLAFSASGDLFTTWWGRGPYRWPVSTADGVPGGYRIGPPTRLPLPPGETIAVGGNGRFVGVAHGNGATLLDAQQPDRPIHLGPQHDTRFLAISPDGRWAGTGSHQSRDGVKVWSLPDGQPVQQVPNPSDCAVPLFSPDGRWLVASTAGIYGVLTTDGWAGGQAHVGWGRCFTPDSRLLAVADSSGSVRLVEPTTNRLIATLEEPNATNALSAVFTPDGSRLIYTSKDSLSTHVWDLRAIRRQLAEIDLDWDWPRIPDPEPVRTSEGPLRLEIDLGELKGELGRK